MGLSKFIKIKQILFIVFATFTSMVFADSTYTVSKGDTLYSISRKYEITVAELRAANNLSESDLLKTGVKLVIPSADISNAAALTSSNSQTKKVSSAGKQNVSAQPAAQIEKTSSYEVKKGDTLYGIARKFNIKLPELLVMNSLDTNATLKVGQKLKVPGSAQKSVSANPAVESKKEKAVASVSTSANISAKKSEVVISNGVIWPLSNPIVKIISGKISGVQLTGKENESVKCVHEGTVMYTGVYRGFGEVVFVQSKTGLIYSYTGLGTVTCRKGDYLLAGTELGVTGKGNESSIKFMVFQNGMPADPVKAPRG